MILKDLWEVSNWLDVLEHLKNSYDISEKEIEFYKDMYYKLYNYEPESSNDNITIIIEEDVEDDMEGNREVIYHNVLGKSSEGEHYYSLALSMWSYWLGYDVKLDHYSPSEFIAHCLFEMSFYGDEDDIKDMVDDLQETIDSIDNKNYKKVDEDCPFCDGGRKPKEDCRCNNGKVKMIQLEYEEGEEEEERCDYPLGIDKKVTVYVDGEEYCIYPLEEPIGLSNPDIKGNVTEITHVIEGFDNPLQVITEYKPNEVQAVHFAVKLGDSPNMFTNVDEEIEDTAFYIIYKAVKILGNIG